MRRRVVNILLIIMLFLGMLPMFNNTVKAMVVTTNASTGVEETNATLRGYVNGSDITSYGFEWGTTTGYGNSIYFNISNRYVYAGGGTIKKVFQYWQNNMTKKAETLSYGGNIYAIADDDTYVYAGGYTTQKVFQYWKSNMTKKAETQSYGGEIRALADDDTYVYAGGDTTNKVFQYWKSNMTKKAETLSYGGNIYAIADDDTYVYAGGYTTQKVFQYWKSNMTKKAETPNYGGNINALAVDDTYVYAAGGTTRKVFQYWKSNMTKKAETPNYGGIIYALAVDDTYVYAGGDTTNKVFQYWKSNMTKKAETSDYGGTIYALADDDTYIYAGGYTTKKVFQYWKSNMTKKAETQSYGGGIYALAVEKEKTSSFDYSYEISGLSPGTLYHYRAFATNGTGTGYGSDMTFLTKPNGPTGLVATPYYTSIDLSWTKGSGANRTVIVRKQSGYPSNPSDGTIIYNNTGNSYTDTGLNQGQGYFYRAWSFSIWGELYQWSDSYSSTNGITIPGAPTNTNMILISATQIKINWTKGVGANNTVVRMSTTGYPSSPTDGTLVYNGTGLNVITSFSIGTTYYYRAWSWSSWAGFSRYSSNYTNITYSFYAGGVLFVNCYDESTGANLTFNILVTNKEGTQIYSDTNCVNTLLINASLCPQGAVTIIISASGYKQRVYSLTISSGMFYLLNAYLAPVTIPGEEETCDLMTYIDSKTVTNPNVDCTITLTHKLISLVSVELYNKTLYGTYGGWMFISSDKYTYNTTHVVVDDSILNINTSMVRVTYYYEYCHPGKSALYNLRVINEMKTPLEDVFVTIKKYISITGTFETITSLYTDANGFVRVYLIPNTLYKVFLNKSGYKDSINEFIAMPPNQYGQTDIQDFILKWIEMPPINYIEIIFTAVRSNTTIFVNYTDAMNQTINATISIYLVNGTTGNLILIGTQMYIGNNTFNYVLLGTNTSCDYKVYLFFNHSVYGSQTRLIIIEKTKHTLTTPNKLNTLLTIIIGPMGPFLWQNGIMFLCFVVMMFSIDKKDAGKGLVVIGGIFIFVSMIGFIDVFQSTLRATIPALFIIVGLVVEWINSRRNQ